MTDPIPELAAAIDTADSVPSAVMRVAVVTAVEIGGSRRVQLDIGDVAWISRVQDCSLAVGDRVSVLQQGPIFLVIGRLSGGDAMTPIGAVLPFAGASPPTGWLLADGSAVSRTGYAALFAVCGTTYGTGDGTSTFNLPNLSNRFPTGPGTRSRGATAGSATITLGTSNIPAHDHSSAGGHSHSGSSSGSAGNHGHGISGSTSDPGGHVHNALNQGTRSDITSGGGTLTASGPSGNTGSAGGHTHSLSGSTDNPGDHSHSMSLASDGGHTHTSVGSGSSFSVEQPLLVMPYIVRAI